MNYRVSKEDLDLLVRKVYEEACFGYLDLKDSVCENIVQEFLKEKPTLNTTVKEEIQFTVTSGNHLEFTDHQIDQHMYSEFNGSYTDNIQLRPDIELRPDVELRPEITIYS